jgi:hypothetical protein
VAKIPTAQKMARAMVPRVAVVVGVEAAVAEEQEVVVAVVVVGIAGVDRVEELEARDVDEGRDKPTPGRVHREETAAHPRAMTIAMMGMMVLVAVQREPVEAHVEPPEPAGPPEAHEGRNLHLQPLRPETLLLPPPQLGVIAPVSRLVTMATIFSYPIHSFIVSHSPSIYPGPHDQLLCVSAALRRSSVRW